MLFWRKEWDGGSGLICFSRMASLMSQYVFGIAPSPPYFSIDLKCWVSEKLQPVGPFFLCYPAALVLLACVCWSDLCFDIFIWIDFMSLELKSETRSQILLFVNKWNAISVNGTEDNFKSLTFRKGWICINANKNSLNSILFKNRSSNTITPFKDMDLGF